MKTLPLLLLASLLSACAQAGAYRETACTVRVTRDVDDALVQAKLVITERATGPGRASGAVLTAAAPAIRVRYDEPFALEVAGEPPEHVALNGLIHRMAGEDTVTVTVVERAP